MRLPTQGMILEMMFLHRASIHSRLTSHPGEEGHGWVGRLLERVPTGRGVMSTVHKTGTDILSPAPTPPHPYSRLIPAPMEQQLLPPVGVLRSWPSCR